MIQVCHCASDYLQSLFLSCTLILTIQWGADHRFLTSALWSLMFWYQPACLAASRTLVAKHYSLSSTCEDSSLPQFCISLCLPTLSVHPACMSSDSWGELSLQGWQHNFVPPRGRTMLLFFRLLLPLHELGQTIWLTLTSCLNFWGNLFPFPRQTLSFSYLHIRKVKENMCMTEKTTGSGPV